MCASKTAVYRSTSDITFKVFQNECAQLSDEKRQTSCTSSISFVSVKLGRHTYLERNCLKDHQRLNWTENHLSCFQIRSPVENSFQGRDQLNTNKVYRNARPLCSQLTFALRTAR